MEGMHAWNLVAPAQSNVIRCQQTGAQKICATGEPTSARENTATEQTYYPFQAAHSRSGIIAAHKTCGRREAAAGPSFCNCGRNRNRGGQDTPPLRNRGIVENDGFLSGMASRHTTSSGRAKPELRSWGAHPPSGVAGPPRGPHAAPPAVPMRPALFHAHRVFREGAENCSRGGCAPQPTSEFGLSASDPTWGEHPIARPRRSGIFVLP